MPDVRLSIASILRVVIGALCVVLGAAAIPPTLEAFDKNARALAVVDAARAGQAVFAAL